MHFPVTSAIMQQQHFKIGSNHHFLIKKHFYFGKNRSVYRLLEAHLYRLLANFSFFCPFTATSHLATTASETLCTKAFQKMCGSVAANLKKIIPYNVEEFCKCKNVYFGEIIMFKFCKVMIVADDIGCSSSNCTINKLVIVISSI